MPGIRTLYADIGRASHSAPLIYLYAGNMIQNLYQRMRIDLRYILASLGYGGGLKSCEQQLGITRPDLEDVDF